MTNATRRQGARDRLLVFWRTRVRTFWREDQWLIITALWVFALVLGWIGFSKARALPCQACSFWDILYLAIQLIPLQSGAVNDPPLELAVARLLLPGVAAYTALQAALVVFRQQIQMFRLQAMRDHVVICGLGRAGFLLATGFHERGRRVVAIERDEDNSFVAQCRENGVIVLIGDARDRDLLDHARVATATCLISVCTNDGANAEVALRAHELVGGRKKVLTCVIRILDLQLCALLRQHEIVTDYSDPFRLELFNLYDAGARALLKEFPPFSESGNLPECPPHILVVGLGHLGDSVVVQAARMWLRRRAATDARLSITIVDRAASRKIDALCLRYPQVKRLCRFTPQRMDVTWPEFRRGAFLWDADGVCTVSSVYICLDDDALGLATGLAISELARKHSIQVIVRMTHEGGLASLLHKKDGGPFGNLHAFALLERTCQPELVLGGSHEIMARAIHEEFTSFKESTGAGDRTAESMKPWEQLAEVYKESNRRQADHIGLKLGAVGCGIAPLSDWDASLFTFGGEEIELMARLEHERWMVERLSQGWKLGPVRDDKKKLSPYLVSWGKLPEDVKEWDRNTVRRLPIFLAQAGFEIYRLADGRSSIAPDEAGARHNARPATDA